MYTYIYIYNIYIHIRDAIRNFSGQGRFLEKKANTEHMKEKLHRGQFRSFFS